MRTRYPRVPGNEFHRFVSIVRRLRHECPWDKEQTHQSIRHSLIEEAYEVVEALDENNLDELRNELGDLLLHVVMHSTIAEQGKEFTLREVIAGISDKLVRRHPHVFGTKKVKDVAEVKQNWEKLKMSEGRTSVLEGVPKHLPALQRAMRIQERAAKVGFEWRRKADVWKKVKEETRELESALGTKNKRRREEEFGDFLFAIVNYARYVDVNPENALRSTIEKFIRRFRYIEKELKKSGKDIHDSSLEEMDKHWDNAKKLGV
ncbi:MAG: Nucleoside triphosphate pyrophosphohydrolase [Bacteroidetes bacterium]|nr:Nucleoside triphosphate pyrophosphohydrolase [Bacteroidota bacterium]